MTITSASVSIAPAYSGDSRPRPPVIGSSGITQENGNYVPTVGVDFPIPAKELFISNDSANNLSFVVSCGTGTLSYVLLPGETFNEAMPLFTQVAVTVTGLWRWYVRGNLP